MLPSIGVDPRYPGYGLLDRFHAESVRELFNRSLQGADTCFECVICRCSLESAVKEPTRYVASVGQGFSLFERSASRVGEAHDSAQGGDLDP